MMKMGPAQAVLKKEDGTLLSLFSGLLVDIVMQNREAHLHFSSCVGHLCKHWLDSGYPQ